MDSVYGSKKYFQSLSGRSDVFRGPSCRALTNDYSYNNTLGRHSPIGPYMHMSKQTAYSTDLSLNSQYGYNTWGTMTDIRNITPTLYPSKRRHKFRSFSIILTTAALIVLLAVLSIGALAFYFSGFKPNVDESMMMFEGSFQIQKGDLYSSGLKNNQSSIFRQKSDFYRRFIERSLSDNDLPLSKLDIRGFGEGPLIDVQFVMLLDMRNIPQNIHSVEDHIRNSLFLETNSVKSLYKFIRIEPDSVRVKRITGENMNRLVPTLQRQEPTDKQSHFEKKLSKTASRNIEKGIPKHVTTHQPKWQKNDGEPDVDVENAPVIQGSFEGSFEITKTDADITAKKASPTKSFSPYLKQTTASIGLRSKTKKTKVDKITTTTPFPSTTVPITTTIEVTTTSTTTTTTTAPTTTTTTANIQTTTNTQPTTSRNTTTEGNDTASQIFDLESAPDSNVSIPPKLDLSLFTSAPILDTKPWHPIQPSNSHYSLHNYGTPARPGYNVVVPAGIESGLIPRNKIQITEQPTNSPNKAVFYQSFTNPVFMPDTSGIEKLGSTDVRPYPIPVPLIDDVVAPNVKPVLPMHKYTNNLNYEQEPVNQTEPRTPSHFTQASENNGTAEHGIEEDEAHNETTTESEVINTHPNTDTTIYSEIGEILLDLLQPSDNDTRNDKVEERIVEVETEKPHFLNIKDLVLNKTKSNEHSTTKVPSAAGTKNKLSSPGIMDDEMLFPAHTKYDPNDQTSHHVPLKKTYNDTLQALIVENQASSNISLKMKDLKRNSSEDIENITLIFDTLSSKLGITPNFPTKEPPFSTSSQQKIKNDQKYLSNLQQTTKRTTSTTTTPFPPTSARTSQSPDQSSEPENIVGEAEVEVVDPTKYEEMLSSQSVSSTTMHTPSLVTLLPVRSNSGIRTFKPVAGAGAEGRKFNSNLSSYREAVVTTGIQVST